MRIHALSAYPEPQNLAAFRALAARDRFRVHQLVERPEDADLVVFVEQGHEGGDRLFRRLRAHPLVRSRREDCFLLNPQDQPFPVLPGLYSSIERRDLDPARLESMAYLYESNPCIEALRDRAPPVRWLFSFRGQDCHPVRRAIFRLRHPEALLTDTTDLQFDGAEATRQRHSQAAESPTWAYARLLQESRFVLCPRGWGASTLRLFETMCAGRAPVILSDAFVPPTGPRWRDFAIFVPEAAVPDLPAILEAERHSWRERGARARQAWLDWFGPEVHFHRIVEALVRIRRRRRRPEWLAQRLPTRAGIRRTVRHTGRRVLEALGLGHLRPGARHSRREQRASST